MENTTKFQVGQPAPAFNLEGVQPNGEFKKYSLSDYKGKWLVMFFYPLDFTFVCPTEITGYSKRYPEFAKTNAEIVGISTDSVHSHKAWLKELGTLNFPLLSDITKKTSDAYNVLLADEGIALRGTFIVDPDGVLRYALYHDNSVGRSAKETLRVLEALQTGGLCAMDWEVGQSNLNAK